MNWSTADLTTIPEAYRAMLFRYVEYGAEPPSIWFTAILANDLLGVLEHSPTTKGRGIAEAMAILQALQAAPQEAWGSRAKVHQWMRIGGLRGQIRSDVRLQ